MKILGIFLILFGLPFIIYFLIKSLQSIGKNANLKSKKGISITLIIVIIFLALTYYFKGFFIGLLVFLLLPFLLIILWDAENRLFSNNQNSFIEKIYTSIPFPLLIVSYVLFFITAVWLAKYASKPNLIVYIIFGGVCGVVAIIKKKNALKYFAKFIKQNNECDAEPNAPMPKIEVDNNTSKLVLSYYLNDLIHDDINEKDIGILEFNNCYKYRLSPNNDEGQCRFLNTDIELGNFYEIIHSNWINDFPTDGIIIDNTLKGNQALQHYLFYFRDETFECIAISHCFSIKAANSRPNPTT